ncbi:coiled-coil domain-containing protein 187 isoform X2 [Betta splendens]|uniref:Coiled-coil domain-containing protein 187 isoform X2 n=1 Tax=Betta splendens TaxID=158456 RepID=A0A6P7N2X1_BETSP|nr:coiled-coil domain-containing protein 187 isoform X2 [Betta splendens]
MSPAVNPEASHLFSTMTQPSASPDMCQCFAVLEDGALAHNLQEQEIEQYYTTNIQKNQLVQNDIRVAKRLQDEEEEQQAQQSALLRQASRQLEEQDFEYARVIQEELQRGAEEAWRREQDDERIAKQMQEEEEQIIRRRSRESEGYSEGSTNDPALPSPHQHTLSSLRQGEERSATTRWQHSTSESYSDIRRPKAVSPRRLAAHENTTSWSNQGHVESIRHRSELSEDSEDSDTVFAEQLSALSQRLRERLITGCPRQQASLHYRRQERSHSARSSFTVEPRSWRERGERYVDYARTYDNNDLEIWRPRNHDQERSRAEVNEGRRGSRDQDRDSCLEDVRERRCSLDESFRLHDRRRHSNRHLARTWSYKDNADKRVHFQEDTRRSNKRHDESNRVWEMLGQVLRERGVPVRVGCNGAPLQILPQSRDSQVLHGSEVSCSDSQPHQRLFQRAATTRHSFHGDIRERRRSSNRENSGRDHREDRGRQHDNAEYDGGEISSRDSYYANRERRSSRRSSEPTYTDYARKRNTNHQRVKRTTSEHRHWHRTIEERVSSEEEEQQQQVERRAHRPHRRTPQHSRSFSSREASTRDRSRHMAAVTPLQLERGNTSLNLGELQQVLQDEELARRLQEEEEESLLRGNSRPATCRSYPEGDFRVAQVAQDEEIARFMQKQEVKSKRRSSELDGPASWREHRAMISHHDRQTARERQFQQERLDSEGLPSPTEDCSPEYQPSSPVSPIPQTQQIRNIAEELDPTFQARRQDPENVQDTTCLSLPVRSSGIHDFEEPTFIPPTKRQTDKSGRTKPKEKKENCKQQ